MREIDRLCAEHVPEIKLPAEAIAAFGSMALRLSRVKSMMPAIERIREFARYAINLGQYGTVVSAFPAAKGA